MKNLNLTKQEILNRIGYFRNKKNISAYKLGLELGHAKTYFYRIESGEIQLTLDTFLEVLSILEISTFEFFYPDLENYEKDKNNFSLFKSLDAEQINSLLTILKIREK